MRPKSVSKKDYFGKEIFALKLFGVSLIGDNGIAYKIYSFVLVFATTFMYPLLDFCEYFRQDFDGIAEIVIYQVAGVLTFCKITYLYRNRVSLVNLLSKLGQKPFLANLKRGGDKEEKLIKECELITKVQSYIYWISACLTIVSTVIYGIIKHIRHSDDHKLPYGPLTFMNTSYSPNYEIIYFYQSISLIYNGSLFSSVDLLIAGVLVHLCYQFKILQNNIKRLLEIGYEEMMKHSTDMNDKSTISNRNATEGIDGSLIPWIYLKKPLNKAIEYHLAIIDIATEIEETFRILFLMEFLGTLALLCFSVYSATAMGHNPQIIARHLSEGVCAAVQVATVCFWGEQVMHESQEVGRAISESNFVGTDLRYQKMLAFIIRRTQNPTKFTAGKFAVICLATFTWVLRTSYSSFMVLRRASDN